ncbi:MAG: PAS domain S-box protein, partial [Desulfuromonadales bacterium]|nr:PAS domain S-box protein [Desulfuromonadales bacterium]
MRKRSDAGGNQLLEKLIGLGERSFRKSHYPELQRRLDHLERFRTLLDHTRDIILLAQLPSTRIVDGNASACQLLGYPLPELEQLGIEEVLDLEGVQWPDEGCLEDEGMLVSAMRRRDGSTLPVEFSLCVDDFGTSSYLVVVARDITERLSHQELLRHSEERFRSVFLSAGIGMAVITPTGEILQVNPALCGFLGYDEGELLRLRVFDLTHPEDLERTQTLYREVLKGERQTIDYEKRYLRRDGQVVWGHATVSWLYDPHQRPIHCVAQIQDITERKRAEELLRETDRMKTEFISTAAHEFRTPLTSIQGFSELLLDATLTPGQRREFLTYIHEKAVALGRIVGELLDIARIEAGHGIALNLVPTPVGELLGLSTALIQADQGRHRFVTAITGEEICLSVDRDKVGQVLENLFSNAIKYSPPGTVIRLVGEPAGAEYRVSLYDQGIGMTAEQVARVFDKFYRADFSNQAVGGIGLGMSIVRSIVEAHGGRIWLD